MAVDALKHMAPSHNFSLEVVDIDADPILFNKYWDAVPVVRVDGKDVFDARDVTFGPSFAKRLEKLVA